MIERESGRELKIITMQLAMNLCPNLSGSSIDNVTTLNLKLVLIFTIAC